MTKCCKYTFCKLMDFCFFLLKIVLLYYWMIAGYQFLDTAQQNAPRFLSQYRTFASRKKYSVKIRNFYLSVQSMPLRQHVKCLQMRISWSLPSPPSFVTVTNHGRGVVHAQQGLISLDYFTCATSLAWIMYEPTFTCRSIKTLCNF